MAEKLYTQKEVETLLFEQRCYSLAVGIVLGNIMSILIQATFLN